MMKKLLFSAAVAVMMTFTANAQDPVITSDFATAVNQISEGGALGLNDTAATFTVNAGDMPIMNDWGGNNNPLNVFVSIKNSGGTTVGTANFTSATTDVVITNVDTPNNQHDLEYTVSQFNVTGAIASGETLTLAVSHFNVPAGGTNRDPVISTTLTVVTDETLSTAVTKISGLVVSTVDGAISVNKGSIVSISNILGQTVTNGGLSGVYVVTIKEGSLVDTVKVAL